MKRTFCLIPALGLAVTVLFAHAVAVAQPSQVSYQGELVSDGTLAGIKQNTLHSNDH